MQSQKASKMILTYKLINKTGTLPVFFFVAYKSSILSVENIKEGAKNGNKKISSYRRD